MTEYGLFAQDEWHVRPTLTLNAGLRYDFQKIAQPDVTNPDAQLLAAGINTGKVPEDHNNIGPRVGFAWTPNTGNRTVVRGGYGIFYGRTPAIMIGTAHSNNGINVQTLSFTGALIPTYPNIYTSIPTGVTLPKPTIFAFDKDFQNPKVQQASFGVEEGITNDILVGINYQWVKGTDLPRSIDINVGDSTQITVPVTSAATGASLGSATFKRYSSVRPFTNFARIIQFQSSSRSLYNGLTFDVQKRFSNNWQARLAWTTSKVKDDRPDATAVVPGTDDPKFAQDALNLNGDYAPGDNDVKNRIVLSGVWSLDSYAQHLDGVARGFLGGWSISGIAAYQTGQPYTAFLVFDLNKDIHIWNGMKMQLIAEGFNVTNRSNVSVVRNTYAAVTSAGGVPTGLIVQDKVGANPFGLPTTSAGPRILQFAAKMTF
jgi:outer membrane receptor protein involved in Fe transport